MLTFCPGRMRQKRPAHDRRGCESGVMPPHSKIYFEAVEVVAAAFVEVVSGDGNAGARGKAGLGGTEAAAAGLGGTVNVTVVVGFAAVMAVAVVVEILIIGAGGGSRAASLTSCRHSP